MPRRDPQHIVGRRSTRLAMNRVLKVNKNLDVLITLVRIRDLSKISILGIKSVISDLILY